MMLGVSDIQVWVFDRGYLVHLDMMQMAEAGQGEGPESGGPSARSEGAMNLSINENQQMLSPVTIDVLLRGKS